jgi:hypothetical protein
MSDSVQQYREQFLQGQLSPMEAAVRLSFSTDAKNLTVLFLKSIMSEVTSAEHADKCLQVICCIREDSAKTVEYQAFVTALIAGGIIKTDSPAVHTLFANACAAGNEVLALKLLEIGINVNLRDEEGMTPFDCACISGLKGVISAMLERADSSCLDLQEALKNTLLSKNREVIELLLQHGASLAIPINTEKDTALHLAIKYDFDPSFCEFLIQKGGPLDARNSKGVTPLLLCIKEDNQQIGALLLSSGANVDLQDEKGFYPLEVAQMAKKDAMAALFTQGKAVDRNLLQKREDYTARLSLSPPLPLQHINNPKSASNIQKFESFIQSHDPILQPAIQNMIEHTEHISFDEFSKSFHDVIDHLNSQIPQGEEYIVLVEPNKSNKWLAELALPHLSQLPKDVVTMSGLEYALEDNPNVSRLIFFDDASYSGEQLCRFVRDNAVKDLESQGRRDFTIHIAVPYLTEWAEGKLEAINDEVQGKGTVVLAPHKRMEAASKQVASEHVDTLNKNYFPTSLVPNFAIINNDSIILNDKEMAVMKLFGFDCTAIDTFQELLEEVAQNNPGIDQLSNEKLCLKLAEIPEVEAGAKALVEALDNFWKDNGDKIKAEKVRLDNLGVSTKDFTSLIEKLGKKFALLKHAGSFDKGFESRTLTVFDHKVADWLSTCSSFEDGDIIVDGEVTGRIKGLFPGKPPYKTNYS